MKGKSRRAAISAIDKAGKQVTIKLDHLQQTIDGIPMDQYGNLMDPDEVGKALAQQGYNHIKASWRL